MKYDLGGYVIKSNEVVIPFPTPTMTTPTTAPVETTTVPTTSQPVTRATWGCVNTAACTSDHPENCCPGTTFDTSPCGGCEKCCYWDNNVSSFTGETTGWVMRAFCSCETGEDIDPYAYDTNPWSSFTGIACAVYTGIPGSFFHVGS